MRISDERLTELVTLADWMAAQTELGVTPEFSAALRELQACRTLLSAHYDACHGAGCSACIGYADLYPESPVG